MRRSLFVACLLLFPSIAAAGDHSWLDRFVQRAPLPHRPQAHTMDRAGCPQGIHSHAIPSVTRFDYTGYVGGASIKNNNLCARGPGSATGPTQCGTFATDFGGFRGHLGRVFLAPSNDPSRGYPISWNYRAEGPRVTDVFAQRPLRKAILEQHEETKGHGHGGAQCEGAPGGSGH